MAGSLRTWLVLGRVSNLPTVWSNCIAGWCIAGGDNLRHLLSVLVGSSLLYVGGMFLNDACDVEFDRTYCSERPIPRGLVSRESVYCASAVSLVSGVLVTALSGLTSLFIAILLAGLIIVYDVTHKKVRFAPVLMAGCRLLLYLLAGANLWSLPLFLSAFALAAYVWGISYAARHERTGGSVFSLIPLLVPVGLALVQWPRLYTPVFVLPLLLCIIAACKRLKGSVPAGVSLLLAGITLVDLAAVAPLRPAMTPIFLLLFCTALLSQRYVPST